jgi:hypothetical protein
MPVNIVNSLSIGQLTGLTNIQISALLNSPNFNSYSSSIQTKYFKSYLELNIYFFVIQKFNKSLLTFINLSRDRIILHPYYFNF